MSTGPAPTAVPRLVLASASPRRSALLSTLGLAHAVDPADVDESPLDGERPGPHVERLASDKAAAVAGRHPGALVLAGDTVVVRDGRILGKPADAGEAVEMLLGLAGRAHEVASGLALARPGEPVLSRVDETRVRFRAFDRAFAEAYVATGEPLDKAGAYGIQGRGSALVESVEGDYTTVVGLSVPGLLALLRRAGLRYRFDRLERISP